MDHAWVLIVLGFVFVAWVGYATVDPTPKQILKQRLRERAVDPRRLGEACLDELAESADAFARTYAPDDEARQSELTQQYLRDVAKTVAAYLGGGRRRTRHDPIFEKLRRHGLVT